MHTSSILVPFFGMMALTLLVWLYMYFVRLRYILTNNIDASQLATPEKLNALIPEPINYPSNNLKNLFELPVLFYMLCLYLYFSNSVDDLYLYSAWAFFLLRSIHSIVQCTVNVVALRFSCYVLASLALWFMLIRCILVLSANG
jgi:hypothetical protein